MSRMRELYEKVAQDSMLQEKLVKIMKEGEEAYKKMTEEKLTAFAKETGFDVTVEEMQAFFKELAEKDRAELSAGELDMVAGGKETEFIIGSILSYGTYCILASIKGVLGKEKKDCEDVHDVYF